MKEQTIWRWLGSAIVILACAYFLSYAASNLDELPDIEWNATSFTIFAASIASWILVVLIGGLIWHYLLVGIGQPVDLKGSVCLFCVSQSGKYIPGNIGHHLGRIMLAKADGIPARATAQTLALEALWGMSVAGILSLIGLFLFFDTLLSVNRAYSAGLAIAVLGSALFLPALIIRVINLRLPGLSMRLGGGAPLMLPAPPIAIRAGLLFLMAFLLVGIVLHLQAHYFFGAREHDLLLLTTAFAWSWIGGYLTPGAPGGLGVREAILVTAITPQYGAENAIGLAISLRVTTTIGDLVAFLLGSTLRTLWRAKKP